MPILIDYRVCDNSPGCTPARICPQGVISFDSKRRKIVYDNSRCGDCPGPCVRYCPAGAVKYASNDFELARLKKEIEESNLSKDDLLEQKYGIRPSDPRETGKNLIHVDCQNFKKEVLESPLPVVVDFWAEWCAPCRVLAPTFKALAEEYDGKIKFAKMDTEECPTVPSTYGIMSIPTLLFFYKGKLIDGMVGAVPKAFLKRKLDEILRRIA